jgi:hypothetical protein
VNEGKAVDGDDAAVDQVVPVADDVLGHVAAERARLRASLLCFAAVGSTGWWASAATFNQCGASALSEDLPEPTPPPRYGRA